MSVPACKDVYNPGDLCNDGNGGAWMLCNIASSRELKSSGTNSRVYTVTTWILQPEYRISNKVHY